MSSTAEVRLVCLETGFTFAEVLNASSGEGLFRRGVVSYVDIGMGPVLPHSEFPQVANGW